MDEILQEGRVQKLPTSCLQSDPERFQARSEYPRDVRDHDLSDVSGFNELFAGLISVWRDPETKTIYVVDGHRRFELARRTNTASVWVQLVDAETDAEAFAKGVVISIGEWAFGNADNLIWASASRRATVERALHSRWLSPSGDAARELYKHYPDLERRYLDSRWADA